MASGQTRPLTPSKRKSSMSEVSPAKKAKIMFSGGKNPVQLLHEKFKDVEYNFTQEGFSHDPKFTVTSIINGRRFAGAGNSKQRAKIELAVCALRSLGFGSLLGEQIQVVEELEINPPSSYGTYGPELTYHTKLWDFEPNSLSANPAKGWSMPGRDREEQVFYTPPKRQGAPLPPQRITSVGQKGKNITGVWSEKISPSRKEDPIQIHYSNNNMPMSPPRAASQGFSKLFKDSRPANIDLEKVRNFPVMALSEFFPTTTFTWVEGTGRGDRQFKVEAELYGRRFFGEGRSKKLAKTNLAKTIFLCMYDIHDFKNEVIATSSSIKPSTPATEKQLEKKYPLTQLKLLLGEDNYEMIVARNNEKFTATIQWNDNIYTGEGSSKGNAKLKAAKKVLDIIRAKSAEGGKGDTVDSDHNEINSSKGKEIDTSRHPAMLFYELYKDVQFECTESKTESGIPEFTLETTIESQKFTAKGQSKKKAKLKIVLVVFEELHGISKSDWKSIELSDVLEDRLISNNPANHPIVLLVKLNPQVRIDVTEVFSSDTSRYKATAYVGDKEFIAEGPNKKTAKTSCARIALQSVYGIDADTYVEESRTDIFQDEGPRCEIPTELSNLISDAVQKKFLDVIQSETQYKVLAGFVLVQDGVKGPQLEVVSLGTGTKCISGDQIDYQGQTLNDCHGEIIACRGFRHFIFDQLLQTFQNNPDTVLECRGEKYALRSCYKLYLYINTAPCGDGRVFALQSQQQQSAKNKTAGLLRTKIENGQGTIPVPENSVQTSDGLLEGERLRTMSCSDKILKWNALGVQGALLSYFIEPVYLEGIVIGLHYNYEALNRALYQRALKMEKCVPGFNPHQPSLGSPNNMEVSRDTSRATSTSFNWFANERTVEAVNASTGQTVIDKPSRLCKLRFFNKFIQVINAGHVNIDPKTYRSAKMLAEDFQMMKKEFFKSLEENTCGKWIGKPYENDMFGY